MKQQFILAHAAARAGALQAVKEAPDGYAVTVEEPKKRRIQEAKYHAMIGDIAKQAIVEGRKFSEVVWKAWLVDSFEDELKSQGKTLSHPSEMTFNPFTGRWVTLRASTSEFSTSEANMFIEYLYAFGSENEVQWSEKADASYQDWAERMAA